MQECIDESAINNYQQIQPSISNNKFINGILEGYAWPGLTVTGAKKIGMVFEKLYRNTLKTYQKSWRTCSSFNLEHHTYLDDITKNVFTLVLKRFNQSIIKL